MKIETKYSIGQKLFYRLGDEIFRDAIMRIVTHTEKDGNTYVSYFVPNEEGHGIQIGENQLFSTQHCLLESLRKKELDEEIEREQKDMQNEYPYLH